MEELMPAILADLPAEVERFWETYREDRPGEAAARRS